MSQQYSYSYTVQSTGVATEAALCTWRFDSLELTNTRVIPDGCRDFIVEQDRDGGARAFVSDLSAATYQVKIAAGTRFVGVRLKPGVVIEQSELNDFLSSHAPQDLLVGDRLVEFCRCAPALSEALACLASTRPVGEVAKEIGVSTRTLQRVVVRETGKSPGYWRALARARLAAKALPHFARLADAAAAFDFSDQAHLSREMQRWFGRSPTAITLDDELSALLHEPGYATGVIGEQISIRNPLGSVT